jgi:hypothetical protein
MEQRAAIQLLTLKKLSAKDITAELEGVYGHEALSLSVVKKWRKQFVNRESPEKMIHGREDRLEAVFVNFYGH